MYASVVLQPDVSMNKCIKFSLESRMTTFWERAVRSVILVITCINFGFDGENLALSVSFPGFNPYCKIVLCHSPSFSAFCSCI